MKHTRTLLPLALALLLLTSCTATGEDTAASATTPTTTTAATTTTPTPPEPENTYRPDLRWGKAMYLDTCSTPVNHTQEINLPSIGSEKVPCTIRVEIRSGNDTDAVPYQSFEPIEYFTSLGWETLPEDAWNYVNPVYNRTIIFVSPTTEAFAGFHMDELRELMDFYNLDQSLIMEGRILISLQQCSLKELES